MRRLYNALFLIGFVLSAPYYFFRMWRRGNWATGFTQRFGRYSINLKQAITNRQIIWLHAVSVGEMNVCVELVRALQERLPNVKFMVSTTTTTGMGELQKRLTAEVGKIYYPIDRRKFVHRAISIIHPTAIVLVEAEVWPNFMWRAQDSRIPVFLVNARLSDRSYPRYKRFPFLFRPLFASFAAVAAQSEEYAGRLRDVGCRPERVHVLGNMKFDTAKLSFGKTLDVPAMLVKLGIPADAPILLGGSTHAGEEEILLEIFSRLRAKHPKLFLILVPRHFERAREVGHLVSSRGISLCYRSQVDHVSAAGRTDCLVVDSTGELMAFYQHATLAFVGKSLTAIGGQNPIEPAACGKPVVFGPHMENFSDVCRLFVTNGAAVQVADAAELECVMDELLTDSARREQMGTAALNIVRANQGAVVRTADLILNHLRDAELYIAPQYRPEEVRT
jgi:3-deoxy-D-manno-octulosonic-acid transferase